MSDSSIVKKGKVRDVFHKEGMQVPIEVLNALDEHISNYVSDKMVVAVPETLVINVNNLR